MSSSKDNGTEDVDGYQLKVTKPVNVQLLTDELQEGLDTEAVSLITVEGSPETATHTDPWIVKIVSDKRQIKTAEKLVDKHDPNRVPESDPDWQSIADKLDDSSAVLTADELKLAVAKITAKLS